MTDGYDENSQIPVDEVVGRAEGRQRHRLQPGRRRRLGRLDQGRADAAASSPSRPAAARSFPGTRRRWPRRAPRLPRTRSTATSSPTRRATSGTTAPGAPSASRRSDPAVPRGGPRRLPVARAQAGEGVARVHRDRTARGSTSRSTATTLVVLEDGVPQKVESFHESVAPVSVMLALDASGSMTKVSPAVHGGGARVRAARSSPRIRSASSSSPTAPRCRTTSAPARWVSHRHIQRYVARGRHRALRRAGGQHGAPEHECPAAASSW